MSHVYLSQTLLRNTLFLKQTRLFSLSTREASRERGKNRRPPEILLKFHNLDRNNIIQQIRSIYT